jgi:hypothetical protein
MGEKVNQALFIGCIGLVMDTQIEETVIWYLKLDDLESIELINLTIENGSKPVKNENLF